MMVPMFLASTLEVVIASILIVILASTFLNQRRRSRRTAAAGRPKDSEAFIGAYQWPTGMLERALTRCPPGTDPRLVDQGLREFLIACGTDKKLRAAMPSKTVDEAWHEFVLHTLDYALFCDRAYGTFLHHRPETSMSADERQYLGHGATVTSWLAATRVEGLDRTTRQMPALYQSDVTAGVPGAQYWIGWCGSEPCTAGAGTVCVHHAHGMARPGDTPQKRRNASAGHVAGGYVATDGGDWGHNGHGADPGSRDTSGGTSCGSGASCGGSSSCGGGSSSCGGGGCGSSGG